MKTIKITRRLMGFAAALMALTACSESEDMLSAFHSDPNAVRITAEVGKASADGFTRSNPLGATEEDQKKFNENDEISVKADDQEAVTYKLVGSEWVPQGGKFLKWESQTIKFTAYYPASYTGGTITQPKEYNTEADLAAADYMSYSGSQSNTNGNNLTLTMNRLMARVVVEVVGFNDQYAQNTTVNSISINGVKAYKHSVDNKDKYYALIVPCEAQDGKEFLSLEVGDNKAKESLTGIPALEPGKSYTYQLTVGKNKVEVNGVTVADWTTTDEITGGKTIYAPYVTFYANVEQKFKMTTKNYTISELEYSVNDGEWKKVVAEEEVSFGGIKGNLRLRGTNFNGTASSTSEYSTITFTDPELEVYCDGDIRTLLDYKNYKTVDTKNARFCNLFKNCTVLASAPELPATTLAKECYSSMFEGCRNLKKAPTLPAETLADGCYSWMFSGCLQLSTVKMLALSDQITSKLDCFKYWLEQAGTEAETHTLIVNDAAAYNALLANNLANYYDYFPSHWRINCKVLDKDNNEIT